MPKPTTYDFSGWATKVNIKCSDGRTILKDAFKDNDGMTVPLVYHHRHDSLDNVLGHVYLENRDEGVYAYGSFNDGEPGKLARAAVSHGDLTSLSIYANDLVEKSKLVSHGVIREVSLVLAGANPGARIDNLVIAHSDDGSDGITLDDEAIIHSGENFEMKEPEEEPVVQHETEQQPEVEAETPTAEEPEIEHAAKPNDAAANDNETVQDVWETLTDKQKTAVYAIMAQFIDNSSNTEGNTANHSDEGEQDTMKHNVFENKPEENNQPDAVLTHDQFQEIWKDAQKVNSWKTSFLAHVQSYGITNIEYLFPDARNVTGQPIFVKRDTGWVQKVLGSVYRTPFSRIKTILADITADEARARGYVKGALKKDEVINLLRRTTEPQTVYKKQKLDRDDIVDITDFDVVVWVQSEMRLMLDEEIARALLVGDGRAADDADKIKADKIRPIWTDDDMYAHKVEVDADADANDLIDAIARARKDYKGSGNPTLYTTSVVLSDMLLIRDTTGRRIYQTQGELEAALRVAAIVEVPVMEGLHRDTGEGPTAKTLNLKGIVVNLADYSVGADKGGAINSFQDFDIDYNQQKYLLETRVSGALTMPKSALIIEQVAAAEG